MQILKTNHTYIPSIYLALGLLALGGLGYLGFLTFVRNILMPGEFATYGLIVTTVAISFLAGGLGNPLQQFAFLISQIGDVSFELRRIAAEQGSVESARCQV